MNELLRHLSSDDLPSLYWDETSQQIEYGHLTGFVYMMIKRALSEGADRIQASALSLTWSREGKVIGKVDLTPSEHPEYPKSYANQIRKIIDKDPIMRKWTRIVSDEHDTIACDFLS